MLRLTFCALGLAGLLSACTEYAAPTPPQPMFDPNFSDSVSFTGYGYEVHATGFKNPDN